MRIFDINIYRDGGSIEFRIERDGQTRQVWLETPFSGEPRALRINSAPIEPGDPAATQLLADIEQWWATMPPDVQQRVRDVLTRQGPLRNPDAATMHASELSRVISVRDYVARHYAR